LVRINNLYYNMEHVKETTPGKQPPI